MYATMGVKTAPSLNISPLTWPINIHKLWVGPMPILEGTLHLVRLVRVHVLRTRIST